MSLVSVLTRKSLADVTRRKGRTILMILGIMIGVLGLTAVNVANDMVGQAFLYNTDLGDSPDIIFNVDAVPPSVGTSLAHFPNVEKFQLRTQFTSNWYLAGNAGTAIIAINSYQDWQHIQIGPSQLTGIRVPGRGEIVMTSRDRAVQPITLSDTVTVDTLDGHRASLRVVGLVQTPEHSPAQAIAYMSADGLQQITHAPASSGSTNQEGEGPPPHTTQILIKTHDSGRVSQTFNALSHALDAAHIRTFTSTWNDPTNAVDTQLAVTGLLLVIRILAIIALLLVCVMIINTVTTLLTEQMKIIGTMKAIGGTSFQIIRSYLVSVGIYAFIGTALGLGLGLVLSYQISTIVAAEVTADLGPFQVSPWVIVSSVAVGLLAPQLSALLPLWTGIRINVREAIASYGVSAGAGKKNNAWGNRLTWMPQTAWLGLRGAFRKPGRAVLTLLALTLSGAVFMAVQITNESIASTVDHTKNLYTNDITVDLGPAPVPSQRVSRALQLLQNVERIEPLDREIVTTAKGELELNALPASIQFYQPHLVAGRWLTEHEQAALVLSDVAAQRLNVHLGENVTFHLDTQQANWKIVGIVHEVANTSGSVDPGTRLGMAFTTLENLNLALRKDPANVATLLLLGAQDRSLEALNQLRGQIEGVLNHARLQQASVDIPLQQPPQRLDPLLIIYALFYTVAILVALVGLLSLSNTLSASVLERRQEIGILRSLGATGWRVGAVFWMEGLALAVIAWGLGAVVGLPAGSAILNILDFFVEPFDLSFHPLFILTTLLFVIVVSCLSSFGPDLSAARVRIGEALRYE